MGLHSKIIKQTYVFLGSEVQDAQVPHSRSKQDSHALHGIRAIFSFSTFCSRRALFFIFMAALLSGSCDKLISTPF